MIDNKVCCDTKMDSFDEKISKAVDELKRDGYAVLKQFLTPLEVEKMRNEIEKIIKDTDDDEKHFYDNAMDDYFMSSIEDVKSFHERAAFDESGKLMTEKKLSVAFIGQAMHKLNDTFKDVSTCDKIKQILSLIDYKDPVAVTSNIILKNPKVGGEVYIHQDAEWLYTEPEVMATGFWMALDDASQQNGCLEFIPGSQSHPVQRRLVKNKNRTKDTDDLTLMVGDMQFDVKDEQFVAAEVKRGDMVIIDGKIIHRSRPNLSDNARWIYMFHVYDRSKVHLSDDNWLPVQAKTYMPIPLSNKEPIKSC